MYYYQCLQYFYETNFPLTKSLFSYDSSGSYKYLYSQTVLSKIFVVFCVAHMSDNSRKMCSICGGQKTHIEYSDSQWRKRNSAIDRKCKKCLEELQSDEQSQSFHDAYVKKLVANGVLPSTSLEEQPEDDQPVVLTAELMAEAQKVLQKMARGEKVTDHKKCNKLFITKTKFKSLPFNISQIILP